MVVRVSSRVSGVAVDVAALVLPRLLSTKRKIEFSRATWLHIEGLALMDLDFGTNDEVDLLLGAEVYATIVQDGLRRGAARDPLAQNTIFGWTLIGGNEAPEADVKVSSHQCAIDDELSGLVRQFWEQEEPPQLEKELTEEERQCEDLFARTHSRDASSRYTVRLPIKHCRH